MLQTSEAKEIDLQFSLEDLETIKVIGKGNGGVVQLVRHKWAGTLFALKVSKQSFSSFPSMYLSILELDKLTYRGSSCNCHRKPLFILHQLDWIQVTDTGFSLKQ